MGPPAPQAESKISEDKSNTFETTSSEQPPPAKKRKRGQNKHRPRPAIISSSDMLCSHYYSPSDDSISSCPFGDKCKYSHDIKSFMDSKPTDISDNCYVFETYGKCPYGVACRYGSKHLTADHRNIISEEFYDPNRPEGTVNVLSKTLKEQLWKRKFEFVRSEKYLAKTKPTKESAKPASASEDVARKECTGLEESEVVSIASQDESGTPCVSVSDGTLGALTDEQLVKLRPAEKKKV